MIDFPASPTPGQRFTAAGATWIFDGVKWLPEGLAPTVAPGINDNRIINGDMRIDQRNNGASGTAIAYTVDRWRYTANQPTKGTWGQANCTVPGFAKSLGFTSSSAYASAAGDAFQLEQPIEADMITDFAWGTVNAQPVTLSFWAWSSLTGTFSGSLKAVGTTRCYPFSYQIPVASTWTRVVVAVPGDAAGAWVLSGNTGALTVLFDLGAGSTFRGPAGAWAVGPYNGVTGSVSIVGTNGASFYVTGVKLEIGSVATPFNRQSLAKSLADCQRYYQQLTSCMMAVNGNGAGIIGSSIPYPVVMRAAPTVGLGSPQYFNASALATNAIYADIIRFQCTVTASGYAYAVANPLTLSAEL